MTDTRAAELRQMLEAATPGPWASVHRNPRALIRAGVHGDWPKGIRLFSSTEATRSITANADNDADLIAAAVNELPGLLREQEALKAALALNTEESNHWASMYANAEAAIERDRSTLADFLTALNREFESRFWLTEGRGSYEWDDDRYREEFHDAVVSIKKILKPLAAMAADLSNSPKTTAEAIEARRGMK